MLSTRVLRTQSECGVRRFPPDVGPNEILVCPLERSVVRAADFQPPFRKIEAYATTGGALGIEVFISAAGGKPRSVTERVAGTGDGRSTQLTSDADAGRNQS